MGKSTNKGAKFLLLAMAINVEFLYQYNPPRKKVNRLLSHPEPSSGPVDRRG